MNRLQKISYQSNHQPPVENRPLRASEVQRELGISRATAYRTMTDGTLPAYRFSGRQGRRTMVRVSYKDLHEWREAHKTRVRDLERLTVASATLRKW
jgi:excisionase family DNA binding protein